MISAIRLRGYCSKPNVAPTERLSFHLAHSVGASVRTRLVRLINGDPNPAGAGPRSVEIPSELDREFALSDQATQSGSFVRIADPKGLLAPQGSFSFHLYAWPTLPRRGRQALISRWDDGRQVGWALVLTPAGLEFCVGDGQGAVARASTGMPLVGRVWYSIVARYDAASRTLTLSQQSVITSTNSVFGLVVPFDGAATAAASAVGVPADSTTDVLLGGLAAHAGRDPAPSVVALFNGKLDSPRFWGRALSDDEVADCHAGVNVADDNLIARWRLDQDNSVAGPGLGDGIEEPVSGLIGECINQPVRAVTGRNWSGKEHNFVHAPEQYAAIWLHEDALEDCRWPETLSFAVPPDLPSGCYALEAREIGVESPEAFYTPFFVTAPRGTATARILLLIPTFSYLAYANSQAYQHSPNGQLANGHITVLEALDFAMNARIPESGVSLYDLHLDGQGAHYSTWRRPQLNMQPHYQHEQSSLAWQFPADLHLVCWLTSQGFAFDVATDHDVHEQGAEFLSRYAAVMTGTHPEYYSEPMIDAWEIYLARGGRGMYLGGNGMYWVTTCAAEKSHVIEVRRGEQGDQAWRGARGELHHAMTGEKGGLWRLRGRAPQKVWGTGYTAHTMAVSTHYEFLPDAGDPALSWMLEGIDRTAPLGDFGSANGGAAGLEVDRYDLSLGTPPHTRVLATSVNHDANSMLAPEDLYFGHPAGNGEESPLVRADITYFTTPHGGAMFATSSIAWGASLLHNGGDNPVSSMTANVLRRFSDTRPLPELA